LFRLLRNAIKTRGDLVQVNICIFHTTFCLAMLWLTNCSVGDTVFLKQHIITYCSHQISLPTSTTHVFQPVLHMFSNQYHTCFPTSTTHVF